MKCHKCGAENPNNFKFCGQCGASLEKHCTKCGASIPEGARFCPECGTGFVAMEKKHDVPNVLNSPDYLFGEDGLIDEMGYVRKVDARQVRRVKGIGFDVTLEFDSNWAVAGYDIFLSTNEHLLIGVGLIGEISYISYVLDADDENSPSMFVNFERGELQMKKHVFRETTFWYEDPTTVEVAYTENGENIAKEYWWEKYGSFFLEEITPYREVLKNLFGVDIIANKYWEW